MDVDEERISELPLDLAVKDGEWGARARFHPIRLQSRSWPSSALKTPPVRYIAVLSLLSLCPEVLRSLPLSSLSFYALKSSPCTTEREKDTGSTSTVATGLCLAHMGHMRHAMWHPPVRRTQHWRRPTHCMHTMLVMLHVAC